MTEKEQVKNKQADNLPKEKSLAEKFLEEKKHAQNMWGNQFGRGNTSFNSSWFWSKSWGGWGRPIRKHAARSR